MIIEFLNRKGELMAQTDPKRIYVENVRSFFSIPTKMAKLFCEMAVKEQYFIKKYAAVCPNSDCKRIIKSANSIEGLGDNLKCFQCEVNEMDKFVFNTNEIEIIEYYQLNKS